MNPLEYLDQAKKKIRVVDLSNTHTRIERTLRSRWNDMHNASIQTPSSTHMRFWHIFKIGLGGASIAGIALFTTVMTTPTDSQKSSEISSTMITTPVNKDDGTYTEHQLATQESAEPKNGLEPQSKINMDITVDTKPTQLYIDDSGKQTFDISVALDIETRENAMVVIRTLREQTLAHGGYIVSLTKYGTQEILQSKIPNEKLESFEKALETLDVQHTLTVNSYALLNTSAYIVSIDEEINAIEKTIATYSAQLASEELSADTKQQIEKSMEEERKTLEQQREKRSALIAQYDLVSVQVVVNPYKSFWEGNYSQYDRSTAWGLVQYNASKVVYKIIRNSSEVIAFCIWLIIYAVILTPVYFLVRRLGRRVLHSIKKSRERIVP